MADHRIYRMVWDYPAHAMTDPERNSQAASPLGSAVQAVAPILGRVGAWVGRWPYWTVYLVACVVVVVKSGFKWAGTTGQGWFIEFRGVIDAWPLKEPLGSPNASAWQENWAPIAVFKAVTKVGLPYDSATWILIHLLASAGAMAVIGLWIRRTYGVDLGRMVALLVVFGSAAMVLLQEIGRYDSFFFLGAVLAVLGRRWWSIVPGALLLGASSWPLGLGTAGSLVLVGLVLGSRSLVGRGALVLGGCVAGAMALMGLRLAQGGDPWLVRLTEGGGSTSSDGVVLTKVVYHVWNNLIEPFPNWIWAAFGVTWILFALVLLQSPRRRVLLGIAIVVLPLIAAATNSDDGTREIALVFTAVLLGTANALQRRAAGPEPAVAPLATVSPVVLGLVTVIVLVAPVVDINPSAPLNPYQWLSDYGLSIVYSILGP